VPIERMAASMSEHGQLTPLVAVERGSKVEVVDGFKRYEAAQRLKLTTLRVSVASLDEGGQWAAMLLLNRGPQSMAELEEALVIREMLAKLTQVEIGQMVHRHKSWVSRRVGLIERLHPELVEAMRLGLLHPGVARRLLALPPGNQLQIAAAAQSARLGPRDTELLVKLWRRATDPEVKKQLLAQPALALKTAFPEHTRPLMDARLSLGGQQLSRVLHQVGALSSRAVRMLPPAESDLSLLAPMLAKTEQAVCLLASLLGSSVSGASRSASDASGAIGSSAGASAKARA
jgi:ParB/RepB/Spo0J family partition protein